MTFYFLEISWGNRGRVVIASGWELEVQGLNLPDQK